MGSPRNAEGHRVPLGGSTAVTRFSRSYTRSARPGDGQFLSTRSALYTIPCHCKQRRYSGRTRLFRRWLDIHVPFVTRRSSVWSATRRSSRPSTSASSVSTADGVSATDRRTRRTAGSAAGSATFTRAPLSCGPSELPDLRERLCRRARRPLPVTFPVVVRLAAVRPSTVADDPRFHYLSAELSS